MAVTIINASGPQFGLVVNSDGSLNVQTDPQLPTQGDNPAWQFKYIVSGTATGVTGSRIGSVIEFIGVGSYVNVLTYSNNRITNIGSWS